MERLAIKRISLPLFAIVSCLPDPTGGEPHDNLVDGCLVVLVIADEPMPAAVFDEMNTRFSGCRDDGDQIQCDASSATEGECNEEELPVAEEILTRHVPGARAGCTSTCEVE